MRGPVPSTHALALTPTFARTAAGLRGSPIARSLGRPDRRRRSFVRLAPRPSHRHASRGGGDRALPHIVHLYRARTHRHDDVSCGGDPSPPFHDLAAVPRQIVAAGPRWHRRSSANLGGGGRDSPASSLHDNMPGRTAARAARDIMTVHGRSGGCRERQYSVRSAVTCVTGPHCGNGFSRPSTDAVIFHDFFATVSPTYGAGMRVRFARNPGTPVRIRPVFWLRHRRHRCV